MIRAADCRLEPIASGEVAAVIDARTFILRDGREVRLGGIEVPPLIGFDRAPSIEVAGRAAKAALEGMIGGTKVELRRPGAERDRYGRLVAQVFTTEPDRWVQAEMVVRGHARVAAGVGDRSCADVLFHRERGARDAKLGLWADPYYVMRRAGDPAAVLAERGRFTIVEGRVLSVRDSGGTIYVNFGRRWSQDFTVTIAKRNERIFTAAGLEPKKLEGHRIRVRGWIEERGGPWIEATGPEQIEVVGQ